MLGPASSHHPCLNCWVKELQLACVADVEKARGQAKEEGKEGEKGARRLNHDLYLYYTDLFKVCSFFVSYIAANPCSPNPCKRGTCTVQPTTPPTFTCENCPPPYYGRLCDCKYSCIAIVYLTNQQFSMVCSLVDYINEKKKLNI